MDSEVGGAITMFVMITILSLVSWHWLESNCQRNNDVADCELIFDFKPKEKSK